MSAFPLIEAAAVRSACLPCRVAVVYRSLSVAIPWQIVIQGGAWEITAELGGLNLAGLEIKGDLIWSAWISPRPLAWFPCGSAGEHRGWSFAARVHLQGWASELVFDEQTFSAVGNNVRLQSSGFDLAAPYYHIEVASSANQFTITSG